MKPLLFDLVPRGFRIASAALLFAMSTPIAGPAMAQSSSTQTWSGNATADNGANQCMNENFPCNGGVSGTISTILVPNPSAGTSGPVATTSLPTGLSQIPVVSSVDLTVTANYNDICCVLNGVSGTASATIDLSGGNDFFLSGGLTSSGFYTTSFGNAIAAMNGTSAPGALSSTDVLTASGGMVLVQAVSSNFAPAALPSVGSGATVNIELTPIWLSPTTVTAVQTEVCGVASFGCSEGATLFGTTVTGSFTAGPSQIYISNQTNGNWNDSTQWLDGNGHTVSTPPSSANPVFIIPGQNFVFLGAGSTAQSVVVESGTLPGATGGFLSGFSGSSLQTQSLTVVADGFASLNGGTITTTGNTIVGGAYIDPTGSFGGAGSDQNGAMVNTGATHTVGGDLLLGDTAGSLGTYTLQGGGTLQVAGRIEVGGAGFGLFTQQDPNSTATASTIDIGSQTGFGTYTVSEGNVTASKQLIVGNGGNGTFNEQGSNVTVSATEVDIGTQNTSSGTYNLTAGSLQISQNLIVGGSGTGILNQSGGQVEVGGGEGIGVIGKGLYTQSGGTHTIDGDMLLGITDGASGSYHSTGSAALTVEGGITVGGAGGAIFTQEGVLVAAQSLTIGANMGGIGAYTFDNGVLAVADAAVVGGAGTGTFLQAGGNTNAMLGSLTIGRDQGSGGSYMLNQGLLNTEDALIVGGNGSGTFVQNFGQVLAGSLSIADGANSLGAYTLNDGGLAVANDAVVGTRGQGIFVQNSGTVLFTGSLILGNALGASGSYTQNGGTNTVQGSLTLAGAAGTTGSYTLQDGGLQAEMLQINSGGTYSQTGGGSIIANYGQSGGQATFSGGQSTAGDINKTGGTLTITTNITALGDVTNSAGLLTLSSATMTVGGGVNNTGDISISTATLNVGTSYIQTGGSLLLQNGAINAGISIIINGGTFGGEGTVGGNITNNGGTVEVGASPDALVTHGNYSQTGGEITFEIDPDGKGGFLESTLVLDKGVDVSISDTDIVLDFLNGADANKFFEDGLLNIDTFFNVSNGDPFGMDFPLASVFQDDGFSTNLAGESITNFDPDTGALTLVATGTVPEPDSLLLLLSGLTAAAPIAGWRRWRVKRMTLRAVAHAGTQSAAVP